MQCILKRFEETGQIEVERRKGRSKKLYTVNGQNLQLVFLGNKSWKDLTQGLSHISDQSVWLQGSLIRNGQVLKEHEQIEKAEVCQHYTTTALKNRSYGVMNTNLRFFINMRGGGRERDTTVSVQSYVWVMGLQRIPVSVYRTLHSPQHFSTEDFVIKNVQKSAYTICYLLSDYSFPLPHYQVYSFLSH